MKTLRKYLGVTLMLCFVVSACTEQVHDDREFEVAMTELSADIINFREEFVIKLSDVNREIEQLRASIQQDDTRDETEITRDETQELLNKLKSQLDILSTDLSALDMADDSAYVSSRAVLEKGLNKIVTEIEIIRLNTIEDRRDYENALDARLHELELELMDMQRRVGRVDTLIQADYALKLSELWGRQNDILAQYDELVNSDSKEAFLARRITFTEEITTLGADIRATTNEVLRRPAF